MEIHLASSNASITKILVDFDYPYIRRESCSCLCSSVPEPFDNYELYFIRWNEALHKNNPQRTISNNDIASIIIIHDKDIKGWYTEPAARKLGLGMTLLQHIITKQKGTLTITIPYSIYPYYESVYAIRLLYKCGFKMVFEDKGEIRLVKE
jgi:GNAT superfamily N-acetyltransferase